MNEVNDVINNLCDKLGTTTTYLIPEVAKYYTIRTVGSTILIFISSVVVAILFYKFLKKYRQYAKADPFSDYTEFYSTLSVVAGIILVVLVIAFPILIISSITWVVTPTGSAVIQILKIIGSYK